MLAASGNLSNDEGLPGGDSIVSLGTQLEQGSLELHQPQLHKAHVPKVTF